MCVVCAGGSSESPVFLLKKSGAAPKKVLPKPFRLSWEKLYVYVKILFDNDDIYYIMIE